MLLNVTQRIVRIVTVTLLAISLYLCQIIAVKAISLPASELPDIRLTSYAEIGQTEGTSNVAITGTLNTRVDDVTDRYIFSSAAAGNLDGAFNGEPYSGSGMITLLSQPILKGLPPTVPDTGATLLLMSLGLVFLAGARNKII